MCWRCSHFSTQCSHHLQDKCAADGGTGLIHRVHGVRMGQECHLNYCIENSNTYENRNWTVKTLMWQMCLVHIVNSAICGKHCKMQSANIHLISPQNGNHQVSSTRSTNTPNGIRRKFCIEHYSHVVHSPTLYSLDPQVQVSWAFFWISWAPSRKYWIYYLELYYSHFLPHFF